MKLGRVASICLLLVGLMLLSLPCGVVSAADNTTTEEIPGDLQSGGVLSEGGSSANALTISADFPTVEAVAGSVFRYDVSLKYEGDSDRIFDLSAKAPSGWTVYITPQYDTSKKIASIKMIASYAGSTETVQVVATAPYYPLPDPGLYPITLTAVSDTIEGSVDLKAKISETFNMDTVTVDGLYNTTAVAGRDNIFSVKVRNLGTGDIRNVTFSPDKPEGWTLEFTPDKVDALVADGEQTVDINIKPPAKTVSGDYMISFMAIGDEATAQQIDIRVTVETPTVWGWLGIFIIVLVVAGVGFIFMRFSRR
jgi:uncharacterized membrane protein